MVKPANLLFKHRQDGNNFGVVNGVVKRKCGFENII